MGHRISFLTAFVAASVACGPRSASPPPAAASNSALRSERAPSLVPKTHLEELDGAATDLASALNGRAAIVSLWATWCDSCVAEIAALDRLDAQIRARTDAVVVAVAVGEERDTVAAFARDRAMRYRVLVDPDFSLADALGQRRVPATLVIDRSGRIVFRGGALDAASLAAFRSASTEGT